jgi:LysR family transcriptional regulator, pca operon transcriptional activator
MKINLPRLRHIVTIARLRSFSRAAEELHITQPALSRSVAAFEERFGIRIFDRGRGGVVPTALGGLVIEEAERLLRSALDMEHNLALYGRGEAGRISVGFGPLAASLILPDLSRALMVPGKSLQLHTSTKLAPALLEELLDDEIEMIFANSWPLGAAEDLSVEPVGTTAITIIARGGHPLAGKRGIHLPELREYPVANAVELPVAGLTGEAGAFVCDNYHISRETVLGSDCIWLASPDILRADFEAGLLVQLDVEGFAPLKNEISMITRAGRTMSPAAREVAALVRERFSA